ncbi:MAG: transcriptional regulator NrdR [Planctomycetota bacterium]|nr:transcriptional regulator NrdR [Planctomycetota bacterium]MDI6787646.1 transcriptional regulator NrdR [Planctomycetota bacterium]
MRCPYCKKETDEVIDSRSCDNGFTIRRRRECPSCSRRYTTYEQRKEVSLKVRKKDGSRQPFNSRKILDGLVRACVKRNISMEKLNEVLSRMEKIIYDKFDREVPSREIGEIVLKELKTLDQVAYVRFASVYREFKDVNHFMRELKNVHKKV